MCYLHPPRGKPDTSVLSLYKQLTMENKPVYFHFTNSWQWKTNNTRNQCTFTLQAADNGKRTIPETSVLSLYKQLTMENKPVYFHFTSSWQRQTNHTRNQCTFTLQTADNGKRTIPETSVLSLYKQLTMENKPYPKPVYFHFTSSWQWKTNQCTFTLQAADNGKRTIPNTSVLSLYKQLTMENEPYPTPVYFHFTSSWQWKTNHTQHQCTFTLQAADNGKQTTPDTSVLSLYKQLTTENEPYPTPMYFHFTNSHRGEKLFYKCTCPWASEK